MFGALLYVFIINNVGHIGLKREVERRLNETADLMHTEPETKEKIALADAHLQGICHYVENIGGFPAYEASDVTYFSCGEEKFADLLQELEQVWEPDLRV